MLLLGAQRSGTTLLRWCLDAHPAIAIGPETGFLRAIGDAMSAPAIGRAGRTWTDGWAVDDQLVEAAFAGAFDTVFRAHATRRGAARWGEKTPVNLAYPHRLARTFPTARLVAVVRHPLAVARSLARWGWDAPRAITYWRASAERLVQHADLGGERFHLLRYEDLVTAPETVLRGVLDHVGEPWDPRVLDPRNATAVAAVADGGNVQRAIDASRAWSWTAHVTGLDRDRLAPHADALAWFGYAATDATDTPLPTPPFDGVPVPRRPDSVQPPPRRPDGPEAAPDPARDPETDPATHPAPEGRPESDRTGSRTGPGRDVRAALRRLGPTGLVRRAVEDLRDHGLAGAVRRWRRR